MVSQQPGNVARAYKEGEPLAKRRRVSLACSACRARKSRCDGRRPSCSSCTSLAIECHYEPSDASTNLLVRKDYVSDLEQRLKDVECVLQRHDDLLTGHLASCAANKEEASSVRIGSVSTVGQVQDGIHLNALNMEDPGSDDTKTDGLAIEFVDEPTPAFYGDSSSIVFTRCLLEAMSVVSKTRHNGMKAPCTENNSSECNAAPDSRQQSPPIMESPKNMPISPTTLPPEGEMDALLSTYFNAYGCLFPFLHEPTFRETYNECKTSGFVKAGRGWLGVLNMTFAMATHIDQTAEASAKHRCRRSYVFFQRAVSLCRDLSMRTVSLSIVQYLLLAALYLQGTQRPIQTWTVHGMLVRTAMALGLHSEQSTQGLHPVQQEIRRRTWLTIYCLDKIQSVTCGRPPAIPDEYIVVKMPSAWPTMQTTKRQSNDADTHTAFLDATVRLLQIVGRSVATQYGQNLGVRGHDMDDSTAIQAASAMRQELRRWRSSLPSYLALCEPESSGLSRSESSDSDRLRVILTLRYHFVNILIHRPLLCTTLRYLTMKRPAAGGPLPYRIQLAMAEAHECIRSAENTIEIVHAVLSSPNPSYNKLDVWFFTLFHVFNSALVVLGSSVLDQHGVYINDDATQNSVQGPLNQAVEALDKLDRDNRMVYNCAKFIRRVSQQLSGQAVEQYNSGNGHRAQSQTEDLAYEQILPSFGLPSLTDIDMVQFPRAELLDHSFGEYSLSLDQLNYNY
ncbi:hypothetical protein ASPVEDRAFT_136194 [Aspergillus versicolor CBS 583.65]|uniref:Zn(2)-C6 fungal-type domain-containing protein n=1 Tax=Aspergillus versicolor CBS 583.65 TaxID=1036611 RepID=A0A1L9PRX8_ASPVE|nr:uncharacterized protein ASPVEDRAFT_136194 [Aspergillus versicolor CBS 583.65]OJJ04195.1 hypothetical protein ASPVEDRAFT_136194 [Aspergillus versicolor CBS 583.65]